MRQFGGFDRGEFETFMKARNFAWVAPSFALSHRAKGGIED